MRSRSTFALLAAVAALVLPLSSAFATPITGQISIGGYAESNTTSMGTATGISFANAAGTSVTGTSGLLSAFGAGSGSFAALGACSNNTTGCGTIKDIGSFAAEAPTTSFLTLSNGSTQGSTFVSFDLSSISAVDHGTNAFGGSLTFTALGTINFTGYNSTPGQFILTAQGNNIVSFSATTLATTPPATVTPEPASIALLGTGLLGMAFITLRRNGLSA